MRKILKVFLIVSFLICMSGATTYAKTTDDIMKDADNFLAKGKEESQKNSIIDGTKFDNVSGNVYNIVLAVGTVIAVIFGGVLAIKFMISGIDGKTEVKEALIPYVVGCFVLFSAFGIWKIALTIVKTIEEEEEGASIVYMMAEETSDVEVFKV